MDMHDLFNVPRRNKNALERRLMHLRAADDHHRVLGEILAHMCNGGEIGHLLLQEAICHHNTLWVHLNAILASIEPQFATEQNQ
jgi:hypothetical protein